MAMHLILWDFWDFMVLSFHTGQHEPMDPFARGSSNFSLDSPLNLSTAFSILLIPGINLFYYLVTCTWPIFLMVVDFIFSRISGRCFPSVNRVLFIFYINRGYISCISLFIEKWKSDHIMWWESFPLSRLNIHLVLPNPLKMCCLRTIWCFSYRYKHEVAVLKFNWWKCCIMVSWSTLMMWSHDE